MELTSRTTQLCIEGTQAEFERRVDDARRLYREAWESAEDDHQAAMAAHYVAHLEPDHREALRWNLVALERGLLDERSLEFMGSLLVCVGGSYEALGESEKAAEYFARAAVHGVFHVRDTLDGSPIEGV